MDGRLVHERMSKTGGTNEFGIVLGDRFVVSAKGHGVGISELKAACPSLDLAKLEVDEGRRRPEVDRSSDATSCGGCRSRA